MGFLKFLGWLCFPYIMIFVRWKNVGKLSKTVGIIWALLALFMTIGIVTSGKDGGTTEVASPSATSSQQLNSKAAPNLEATAKTDQAKENANEDAKTKEDADSKVKATEEAAKNPQWNTSEIYAEKNGNIPLAVKLLKTTDEVTQNTTQAAPADVMKTPWNYYGKAISFSGQIGFVQDYPPGSNFEKSGILSQIVIGTEDGTDVDILLTVSSGSLKNGDTVTIAAIPVGIFDNDNMQGGKTQVLAVVANKIN
ncbi:hypothetical protein B5M42_012965 [Paenibacillus athensensis]|uniref:Uncharacterized protein n=1 Tax=Paenibacillus athensensis TaxID=1967502 RepID=A0A4Y8Q6F7_9BACL|nr:hypothetical protein [Paenibacillus athensensis]MCD1259745.1 hypothetical protein [Paenibacillus athensensis]